MKVVIYATDRKDLMKKYPSLKKYENFYNADDYWMKNCIIKEMDNDDFLKVIETLSEYDELVIGRTTKSDHENYGVDYYIEIYNDWRE